MSTEQKQSFSYSNDGCMYDGHHATIEEAFKAALEEEAYKVGDTVHIGLSVGDYVPKIDVQAVADQVMNDTVEEIGEAAQFWNLPRKEDPSFVELSEELNKVFQAWLVKHDNVCTLFKVTKSKVFTLTEAMLAGTEIPNSLD